MQSSVRVAIIGTGPAGLSLAWHLRELGVASVELFDASDEVGGQSVTRDVDGVPVELGTCYLAEGYRIVKDIAADVGCPAMRLPKATMLDDAGRETTHGKPQPALIARFLFHWLRWYLTGQMQWPSHPDNALRFDAWLTARGLGSLASEFTFAAGLTAQLYGPIREVTAHSALTWMRPSLFLTGELGLTAAVPAGFQRIWERVAARTGYPLRLSTPIDAVQAAGNRWMLTRAGQAALGPFDHVFIACPLDALEHPLSESLSQRFGPFEASLVYSAIWRARGWPSFAESRCYLPSCVSNERGRLLTIRRNGVAGDRAVGQLCAYGLEGLSLEEHRQRMVGEAESIVGLRDLEIIVDRLWRYNVRYSPAQLQAKLPAHIDRAQGRDGVWYTGGALSHWNVDSITDFNHELARRFARRIGVPWLDRLRVWRLDEPLRDF